jgi:putative heme-binding domain-containing protein
MQAFRQPGFALRIACCLSAAAALGWAQKNPYDTDQGVVEGAALFGGQCAYCHGAHGEGGRGADLTSGQYAHGGSDAELYATIRNGVAGTGMPPAGATDEQVWKLVAFVKRIGSPGLYEKAAGDTSAGRAIFENKGRCLSCHSLGEEGGSLGPDLREVGRRRRLEYIEESIVLPDADVPLRYRAMQVVTKTGETVSGLRLNEDDVSIQLRDGQDRLRSFMKDDLQAIRHEKKSIMPSYATTLDRKEIEDLVAYLHSLGGVQ